MMWSTMMWMEAIGIDADDDDCCCCGGGDLLLSLVLRTKTMNSNLELLFFFKYFY